MTIFEFFNEYIGDPGRFEVLYYIFGAVIALILTHAIISFLFGTISNIFTGGRKL